MSGPHVESKPRLAKSAVLVGTELRIDGEPFPFLIGEADQLHVSIVAHGLYIIHVPVVVEGHVSLTGASDDPR